MPTAHSVLLAVHCKRGDPVDLKAPVLAYIKKTYSASDVEDADDDLTTIQTLRNEIANAQGGTQPALRDSLIKYFRALTAIETRFPISKEKEHVRISFSWADAFRPGKKSGQYNIHFEKSAVLFNLGACLSQHGLSADRNSGEGLTSACKLFQESAGAFHYLKDVAMRAETPRPVDISPECCSMLEKLMLAQAQECVYNKAVLDNKSPGVLARLAKQTSAMYEEVDSLFAAPALAGHFEKSWGYHTSMKSSLYDVESLHQQSKQLSSEEKVAAVIATLKEAMQRLQVARKHGKNINAEMADSMKPLQDAIVHACTKAEKDNASVYLERIPPFADLPKIQGALLVKATPPNSLEAAGDNYFSTLIPEASTKALSRYTDMVDNLIREQLDKLAGATDTARLRLKELELPDVLDALEARSMAALPDGLVAELNEIHSTGGLSHLQGILAEMGEIRKDVENVLQQSNAALEEEQKLDSECRTKYGDKWTPPLSASVAKHFWDKINNYRGMLQQAAISDETTIQRLHDNEGLLANLTLDSALQQMPRLQAPLLSVSNQDPQLVVANLRRNLELLQQNAGERAALEEVLKEQKQKDNIMPKLMSASNLDSLFNSEVKKYEPIKEDVAKNIAKHEETLAATIRDALAFREIFDIAGWRNSCESAAQGFKRHLQLFKELMDHLSEGLRFYLSLQEAVKTHLQMCTDYAYTRNIQREELKHDIARREREAEAAHAAKRMATLNMQPPPPPPPTFPAQPSPYPQQPTTNYQYVAAVPHPPPQHASAHPHPPPPYQPAPPATQPPSYQYTPPPPPPGQPHAYPGQAPPQPYPQHHQHQPGYYQPPPSQQQQQQPYQQQPQQPGYPYAPPPQPGYPQYQQQYGR